MHPPLDLTASSSSTPHLHTTRTIDSHIQSVTPDITESARDSLLTAPRTPLSGFSSSPNPTQTSQTIISPNNNYELSRSDSLANRHRQGHVISPISVPTVSLSATTRTPYTNNQAIFTDWLKDQGGSVDYPFNTAKSPMYPFVVKDFVDCSRFVIDCRPQTRIPVNVLNALNTAVHNRIIVLGRHQQRGTADAGHYFVLKTLKQTRDIWVRQNATLAQTGFSTLQQTRGDTSNRRGRGAPGGGRGGGFVGSRGSRARVHKL